MCLHFDPNHEKATQALNFLALKGGGSIDRITALKLIFFADRYHIRKYGRPIIGDEYLAMPLGPVPSMTENISEKTDSLDETEKAYADRFLDVSDNKYTIYSRAAVDTDVFSDSDIESLDFAWKTLGHLKKRVIELSHAYPEWGKFKDRLANKEIKRYPMDYADFFLDPEPDNPFLWPSGHRDIFKELISKEEKEDSLELSREGNAIRALWNR